MAIIDGQRSYVAGRWVEGGHSFEVENPADESCLAVAGVTPLEEVRRAITEARSSFDEGIWADRPVAERARVLNVFLDHVDTARETLIDTIMGEAGQPRPMAEGAQVTMGLALGRQTIDLYQSMQHEEADPVPVDDLVRGRVVLSIRRNEPIGVVSAITPYNGAIIMAFQKLIPALMAGNSVILRPSPLTPLSSLVFGAAADAAGLPPGVLSIVIEEGAEGAELLTSDPAVDMVSFTGSTCVAATRMLVPNSRKAEVIEAVCATYGMIKVGDPADPSNLMGPVISAAQRDRCARYIALAEEHGAKVPCGGGRPAGLDKGYYVEPTVLDLPDNANPAARDEIFGPVIGILGYEDLDDAVRIANDTTYGLAGQVYGADVATATAVARRIRAGAVTVNNGVFSAFAAGGGYKQSGLGRERGPEGIREFQEVKHMAIGELQ
jgi:aldehyde dehydrogenase (NAD+)